jgi:hypothetical protein
LTIALNLSGGAVASHVRAARFIGSSFSASAMARAVSRSDWGSPASFSPAYDNRPFPDPG